jgi:predicted transcriptional regulator
MPMARPSGNRYPVRLSVSIDPSDYDAIRKMADELDLSSAWLVRRAVSDFVTRNCGDGLKEVVWLQEKDKEKSAAH